MQFAIISRGDLLRGIFQNINDWKVKWNDEYAYLWIKEMRRFWINFGVRLG